MTLRIIWHSMCIGAIWPHASGEIGKEDAVTLNMGSDIEREIAAFHAWADEYPVSERSGEWECDYQRWPELYRAFSAFVADTQCHAWRESTKHNVLYIIARDNENQILARALGNSPENILCLAAYAVTHREPNATWQLAVELGGLPRTYWSRVEPLLLSYMRDPDEYVQRRVLTVLADTGSVHIHKFIAPMWASNDEYQRMSVLYALWKTNSPSLSHYLELATADGRAHVLEYSERIRHGGP